MSRKQKDDGKHRTNDWRFVIAESSWKPKLFDTMSKSVSSFDFSNLGGIQLCLIRQLRNDIMFPINLQIRVTKYAKHLFPLSMYNSGEICCGYKSRTKTTPWAFIEALNLWVTFSESVNLFLFALFCCKFLLFRRRFVNCRDGQISLRPPVPIPSPGPRTLAQALKDLKSSWSSSEGKWLQLHPWG